jgi:hypothetical protein
MMFSKLLMPVLILTVPSLYGGIVACQTASNTQSELVTLGTGTTNGCYQDDLSYSNIALSGGDTIGSTAQIHLYGGGTAASLDTVGPVDMFTSGFTTAGGGAGTDSGTVTVQVNANAAGASPTPPDSFWNITHLQLDPTIAAANNISVTITEDFCLNATQATTGGNCSAANTYVLTATYATDSATAVFNCTVNSASCGASETGGVVTFSENVFSIAVSEQISIADTAGHGNIGGTVTDVENIFTEDGVTPEPSTFILLGSALLGLTVFRKRKKA